MVIKMTRRPRPHTRGRLTLVSRDLDPREVTARLQIQPDRAWRRGDAPFGSRTAAKVGGWSIDSRISRGSRLVKHLEAILRQLRPARARFKAVRAKVESCVLGLTLGLDETIPMAWQRLPAPLLGDLHELGIDLEFTAIASVEPVRAVRSRVRSEKARSEKGSAGTWKRMSGTTATLRRTATTRPGAWRPSRTPTRRRTRSR